MERDFNEPKTTCKKAVKHTARNIASLPDPKQRLMIHISGLMMIKR